MDSALSRLNAYPGKRDLSQAQAADVLDVSERSIRRMTKPDAMGNTSLGCRITGHMRKTERYKKYGHGHKVLIPRVDVVIYLARHHTKPDDFLLNVAAQCPEHLPAVKAALAAPAGETPANVIPMKGHGITQAKGLKSTPHKVEPWHPNQLALFPDFHGQARA